MIEADVSLIGTMRETVEVAVYAATRCDEAGQVLDDDPPDETIVVERFYEADGTLVTDPERVAAIVAAQAEQEQRHAGEG
jgi:hypothetical protein